MVAQSSRAGAPAPPAVEPKIKDQEKPEPNVKKKKEKKGLLSMAKARASGAAGGLRKALIGARAPKSARLYKDAEDIKEEDEEGEQSCYDTVRSLPASGHYGRSRVGHHGSGSRLSAVWPPAQQLCVAVDDGPPGSVTIPSATSPISATVIRLPRRRTQPITGLMMRTSPKGTVFDFQAFHSALEPQSQEAVYSLFMKAHKCYDLIPTSSKLVVFDTHLPVRKAFYALIYNNVRAAPLYDSAKGHYVGMLTITDFIKILYRYYKAGEDEAKMKSLEEQEISHWRERFEQDGTLREFITIDPNLSLHRAVQLLCEHKVHRLPVLDKATGNISYILTHKRLMKFMALYMNDLPRPSFVEKTPKELGIGSWGDVLTIHTDTPLIEALKTFLKNRVSALPIVDGEGKVVDIYAKFDVISLAAEKVYENLDVTVHEALKHRNEGFEGVHCCHESDSLYQVIETIVRAEVHRLIATDSEKRVVGVVSLSDILKYLVLDHVAKAEPMDTSDYSPPQVFDTLEEEGVE